MKTAAIVIGIDTYANPAWLLGGAVRDAIAFARWADAEADLDPDARVLLLAAPPAAAPSGWKLGQPTRTGILDALTEHHGSGAKFERLIFFYAGHACTPPSRSPEAGPVLVPCDRANLVRIGTEGIDLAAELPLLRSTGPALQLFFIDGCRDIAKDDALATVGQQVTWNLANQPNAISTQAVLYATRSGTWANELGGRGVFTRALLEGLSGRGPALPFNDDETLETLPFRVLAEFVKDRVQALLAARRVDLPAIRAQTPTSAVVPDDAAVVVRSYGAGTGPRLNVRIRVEPSSARKRVTFFALQRNKVTRKEEVAAKFKGGEPVTTLPFPSGLVALRIEADGFNPQPRQLMLRGDNSLYVELEPESGFESLPVSDQLGTTRRLVVTSVDRHVRIVVRDDADAIVAMGRGILETQLLAGTYLVESVLPGFPARKDLIVLDSAEHTLEVWAVETRAGPVTEIARTAQMFERAYPEPSELIGPTSDLRLSSLLAYAAWGAAWRSIGDPYFYKLSHWGIQHPASPTCSLSILIGDAHRGGTAPLSATARLFFKDGEATTSLPSLTPLTGVPFAGQSCTPDVPAGPFEIRLEATGLAPTTFACVAIPGFVTVLVVTREEWGEIEVAQFLVPIDPLASIAGLPAAEGGDIRTHELAARALLDGLPVLPGEYANKAGDPLADGRWSNPLAAVIAGYRLWREGRISDFGPSLSVLETKFKHLDDLRVLRWLHRRAVDGDSPVAGPHPLADVRLPVVAMGFRELLREFPDDAMMPRNDGLVPGTLWTIRAALPRAIAVKNGRLADGGDEIAGSSWDDNVLSVVSGVGRLTDGGSFGTAFLVAPDIVMTAMSVVAALTEDAGANRPADRIIVEFSDNNVEDELIEIVGFVDALSLRHALERQAICALRLARPAALPPLLLSSAAPRVGQAVAVVGYPYEDPRTRLRNQPIISLPGPRGAKFVIPGRVLSVSLDGSFTYNCLTLPGATGACVIDLETGKAVGIHYSGKWLEDGGKIGTGKSLGPFTELLALLTSRSGGGTLA